MRMMVSIAEAQSRLSELVDRLEEGDEVIITRHDKEVARLAAVKRLTSGEVKEKIVRFQKLRANNVLNPPGEKEELSIEDLVNGR